VFNFFINIILQNKIELGIIGEFIMAKVFSQEQVQQLQEELEFTLMCIGNMTTNRNYYVANSGIDSTIRIMEEFKAKKLRLEIEIATLLNFLEG
jgi:hypothetical protein